MLNSKDYYNKNDIECIDAIEASMSDTMFQGFLQGNVIKYMWRWRHKGGSEDLQKAISYLTMLKDISVQDEVDVMENDVAGNFDDWLNSFNEKEKEQDTTDFDEKLKEGNIKWLS